MNQEAIFKVTAEGTYRTRKSGGSSSEVLHYEEVTVRIKQDDLPYAIAILKNTLLPQIIRKKDPRFAKVREVFIQDTVPETEGLSLIHLTEEQQVCLYGKSDLELYITRKRLPVNPVYYNTVQDLRKAVQQAVQSPGLFKIKQERSGKNMAQSVSVADLNADLLAGDDNPQPTGDTPSEKDVLVARAKELGVKGVSKAWGIPKLKAAIEEASQPAESTVTDNKLAEL